MFCFYLLRWGLFYLTLTNRHIFLDPAIRLIRNSITYSFVKQWLEVQFIKTLSVRQLQECHHLLFRPRDSTEQDQFIALSLYIILGGDLGGDLGGNLGGDHVKIRIQHIIHRVNRFALLLQNAHFFKKIKA